MQDKDMQIELRASFSSPLESCDSKAQFYSLTQKGFAMIRMPPFTRFFCLI